MSDFTTEAFNAELKCFLSRRSLIDYLYTDNGSKFIGANRQLKAFFKSEKFLRHMHDYAAKT